MCRFAQNYWLSGSLLWSKKTSGKKFACRTPVSAVHNDAPDAFLGCGAPKYWLDCPRFIEIHLFGAAFHIAHWHIGEDCASSLHPVVNAGEAVKTKKAPFSLRAPCKPPGPASVVFDQAPVLGVMIWFLDRFYKPIVCQSAGLGTNGEAGSWGHKQLSAWSSAGSSMSVHVTNPGWNWSRPLRKTDPGQ